MIVDTEICVVGGGPAGSTVARSLRRSGHRVCLVEREAFPRPHIGQSLPPGILPLFEVLDLRDRIEGAGFLRTSGYVLRWDGPSRFRPWADGTPGWQVDRGRFDALLLSLAIDAGVETLQPASAMRPERDRGRWRVPLTTPRGAVEVRADFLVLASGRRPVLPVRHRPTSEPMTALYATFRDTGARGGESRVDAGLDAWLWGARNADGSASVAAFVDPRRSRRTARAGVESLYDSLIGHSPLLSSLVGSSARSPVRACSASAYAAAECVTLDLIRVGEASLAIDPLSSQGVQAALQSAIHAAATVHTILESREAADAALEFYRARQQETARTHRAWAADCYAAIAAVQPGSFWRSRAEGRSLPAAPSRARLRSDLTPSTKISRSAETRIVGTPVIDGNRIRRVTGIEHPALTRPIVYVEGRELATLVAAIAPGQSVEDTMRAWSGRFDPGLAFRTLRWLLDAGVIAESPVISSALPSS